MSDHAISNAKAWLSEIVELTTALVAADGSDEIECGQCEGTGTTQSASNGENEECPVCDGTGYIARDEGDDADSIRQQIQEGPLSVEVRSEWYTPGSVALPGEFCILLSTGGPALRMIGELDEHGEVYGTPSLQWQDWGTPWTDLLDVSDAEDKALETYAGCFYYAE
jgi:hypothetical protein